jgi:hypothetical protein
VTVKAATGGTITVTGLPRGHIRCQVHDELPRLDVAESRTSQISSGATLSQPTSPAAGVIGIFLKFDRRGPDTDRDLTVTRRRRDAHATVTPTPTVDANADRDTHADADDSGTQEEQEAPRAVKGRPVLRSSARPMSRRRVTASASWIALATFAAADAIAPREISVGRHRIRLVDLDGDGRADAAEIRLDDGEILVLESQARAGSHSGE